MADFVEQRAFFREHGWVVLRGVVSPDEVSRLRAASCELMPDAAVPATHDGVPMVVRPSLRHPELRAWLEVEAPFRAAAAVLGAQAVRLVQDALLVKPPGSEAALAWHQDASYFGWLEPLEAASVRLALGDETIASGCLWVVDGSHRWDVAVTIAFGATRVDDTLARADGDRIPVELAPGDVSIHHARTFHASFPNRAETSRRTLVTHVAADTCRIVRDRLPPGAEAWFPSDADGVPAPEVFWTLPLP